jgi:putative DNA primase/helicase
MALARLPEAAALVRARSPSRRPDAPVIVTEGETAADAAAELLPDHVAITSPGSSKAAAAAD